MRYIIPTLRAGIYGTVEGRTPLSAINALGRNRFGKTTEHANAYQIDEHGQRTSGYILRQGRVAYFGVDEDDAGPHSD